MIAPFFKGNIIWKGETRKAEGLLNIIEPKPGVLGEWYGTCHLTESMGPTCDKVLLTVDDGRQGFMFIKSLETCLNGGMNMEFVGTDELTVP